jgi:hypothetical protein
MTKIKFKMMNNKEIDLWFNSLADECFLTVEPIKKTVKKETTITKEDIADLFKNLNESEIIPTELFK